MTKLVIVAPNVGLGGVERASANIANHLIGFGVKVLFVALIPEPKFYWLHPSIKYVEPEGFNLPRMSICKTLFFIRRHIKEFNPDKILVFTKFYGAITNLSLIGTHQRIYLSERSSPYYRWPLHVDLFAKVSFKIRSPMGLIAQTTLAKEILSKKYKNIPIVVIPNPVKNVRLFPDIRREKIILAVGRFEDPCKGFDRLVKAFDMIQPTEWHLHFMGGKREDARFLEGLDIKEATMQKIRFLGMVVDVDVEYARAGIFVIPSRTEGFPNSLIEAMAAGLPCISFDFFAGPRDIITHETDGIIVENNNIKSLADAISSLIRKPQDRDRLGKNALGIRDRLRGEVVVRKYLDFMTKDLLSKSGRS